MPVGYLYIVHRGIALYRARLITKGRVWGEDMLLRNDRLREVSHKVSWKATPIVVSRRAFMGESVLLEGFVIRSPARSTQVASAKAMNYLEVYYTTRDELMALAERYPATYAKIRRFAVFMALKREIIRLAMEKLQADEDPDGKVSCK